MPPGTVSSSAMRKAFLSENQIRADDARQLVAKPLLPGILDEFSRFSPVHIIRNPGRLSAGEAHLVKQVTGAVEKAQPVAEFL